MDMKKTREMLSSLRMMLHNFQLTSRRCQQPGLLFICVTIMFFIIYQMPFSPKTTRSVMSTPSLKSFPKPKSTQSLMSTPSVKKVSKLKSTPSLTSTPSVKNVPKPTQRSICPKNINISRDAPASLPCGMTINALGRLGNLMGQYATLIALAEINNRPAVILPDMADILKLYFANISLHTMNPDEITFWDRRCTVVLMNNWMRQDYRHLTGVFTCLIGFPSSWTFHHHIRDRILQEFRFNDYILERTHQKLNYYRQGRDSVTFVGVHNRRGDYVALMAEDYHGVVADAGFFQKAFDHFESKYPDAVFLVVSDDMEWCTEHMNNSKGNIYFVGNGRVEFVIYDLALLANCNHSIITFGSFGFWGAYLAGGETVYLSNYVFPDSSYLKQEKYESMYMPEWTPIAANLSKFNETEG